MFFNVYINYYYIRNFDIDGYSQSKFIPINNIAEFSPQSQKKQKEGEFPLLSSSSAKNLTQSPKESEKMGWGGGGLNLPLQRYQYEDVGINDRIYKQKLKPYTSKMKGQSQRSPAKKVSPIKDEQNNQRKNKQKNKNTQSHPKSMVTVNLPKSATQIDKNLLTSSTGRIVITYSLLSSIDNFCILYDGEVFKIQKNKTGYKIVTRYFQITKNCFRYYNSIYSSQVYNNKPLVQFDVRHIANIDISNDNVLKFKYDKITFSFTIYLDNRKDFFEFGTDDPEFGSCIIKVLMLIINYHDDMASKNMFKYEIKDE